MLLLVRDFDWGVGSAVVLIFLRMHRRIPDTPGRLDSLFLNILVVPLWSDQDPLARGRYSFVGEHLRSSIASVEGGLVLFGHRIACSRNKMGDSVCCRGMGFVGRDPSI